MVLSAFLTKVANAWNNYIVEEVDTLAYLCLMMLRRSLILAEVSRTGLGGTVLGGKFCREARIKSVISCASVSIGAGSLDASSVVVSLISSILVILEY